MARILMFSSGLDSFITKHLLQFEDEECLFINMCTRENIIEAENIKKFFPGTTSYFLPISFFELENKIIPFRNHFLALMAAQFASSIYFGFTAGDTTKDKDYVFKAQMEGITNYFSLDSHKVQVKGPFEIRMPFKGFTKREMIRKYLKDNGNPDDLLDKTVSCYAGTNKPCGECRTCLRNYVALALNGIADKNRYEKDPEESLPSFLDECRWKGRGKELLEVEEYMGVF